ncbi:hypothetical protein [Rhodococcus sp. IEGM 1408]|uniref:hypothetical protein n=1 Tax=Rhodococcus sp. IEGM 1408 TaxID=3082220 RepID=UPI0029551110|nr:hypothetical protein [Rhodococcus sp. IEGM 1408]MDV8002793.1 hypothetical protein [Rhodococcus sp. IEGM 1408]
MSNKYLPVAKDETCWNTMSIDMVDLLRELDFRIAEGRTPTSWLIRHPEGMSFEVEPRTPVARLTAHGTRALSGRRRIDSRLLFVGHTATPGVLEQAASGQIDILIAEPPTLIIGGATYSALPEPSRTPRSRRVGKPAWTRWAVARYLLLAREPARQLEIADVLGTSQQAISNASRALGDHLTHSPRGMAAADKTRLLNHWIQEYPGTGGQEFGWYSLDTIVEQTADAARVAQLLGANPLMSGDVAADHYAPWKLPAQGRVYVNRPIDLADDGFVPAPLAEATLITCIPRDPSVWRLTELIPATSRRDGICPADPAIALWDLTNSAGIDNEEASLRLAEYITGEGT